MSKQLSIIQPTQVPKRRRRWSKEEKTRIVEETYATSVMKVSRKYNIGVRLLFGWRERAVREGKRRANVNQAS